MSAGAIGALWLPLDRVVAATGGGGVPSGFPTSVELYRQRYQNWSKEIVLDDLWTCRPTSAEDLLAVVRWAATEGWKVRARGAMHGWSPFLVTPDTSAASRVVLVDTTGLTSIEAAPSDGVRAGAGVRLLDLVTHLEGRGLGLVSVPAVGDITVGGMLAIGAHGAAIPSPAETAAPDPRANFGSLSHAVRRLTVVAWDPMTRRYELRTFGRHDRELAALACALGRTIVVEAELDASPLQHLRCRSHVDIPATELFAPAGRGGRTFASFVHATGRAEALWYPFTDRPWLKVWEVAPTRPLTSRPTSGPYNYPFSDQIPDPMADLAASLVTGNGASTPAFGELVYDVTVAGLAASVSYDLWGPAKDTQLYIQPTTLRVRELGLAVLTSRAALQDTAHRLATSWDELIATYAARGSYPINMPFEIRASALDGRFGPAPTLASTSPDPAAPHLDVVLFTNALTLTGTPDSDAFLAEYEQVVRTTLDPAKARLRPEWSKNFAYTGAGPTTDTGALDGIRDRFRSGRPTPSSWDGAASTFERLDPRGVFTNGFLDVLFQR